MRILLFSPMGSLRKQAHNGGQLRAWQNLASLVALGHEVHLVRCDGSASGGDLEPDVRQLPAAVHCIPGREPIITRLDSWRALVSTRAAVRLHLKYPDQIREGVAGIAQAVRPDVIWAEWIAAMALVPRGFPVVYSHHDFKHKIVSVRRKTNGRPARWPDRLRLRQLRRAELDLCTKADHVVCVSASEREEVAALGQRCTYIPICGPTVPQRTALSGGKGRVFLFGNWGNTAMRFAVRHFRETVWPLFGRATPPVEWHQVGDPDCRRDSEDWDFVQRHFMCHGFVEDLSQLFKVGDASLIPYQLDTGFRTKFVTAAAHGVINVGYAESFRCAPEFTAGQDCLIARTPAEMTGLLQHYASSANVRRRLGEASRALYEVAFSFEAQLPKYEAVLRSVDHNGTPDD